MYTPAQIPSDWKMPWSRVQWMLISVDTIYMGLLDFLRNSAGIVFVCCTSELPHDKTNKMACAPTEDSDQPGHLPSLIRVFAVRKKKTWILSYPLSAQRRLWSDWVDSQADLSLCWAHIPFCWFCFVVDHIWHKVHSVNLSLTYNITKTCTALGET